MPAPTVSVEKAYQREYALLEAQKRELTTRIADVRQQTEQRHGRDRIVRVRALENQVFALRSEAESAADALNRAEQAALSAAENADFLSATLEQAKATLGSYGDTTLQSRMRSRKWKALASWSTLFQTASAALGNCWDKFDATRVPSSLRMAARCRARSSASATLPPSGSARRLPALWCPPVASASACGRIRR
jgi:hypothetical protein